MGWKNFRRRKALKKAVKLGRKILSPKKPYKGKGVLIICPPEPEVTELLTKPVSEWLKNYGGGPARILLPIDAARLAKKILPGIHVFSFDEDDITMVGTPTRDMRRRITATKNDVVIQLTPELNPFTEILFAISQARLKIATYHQTREEYVSLLVRTKDVDKTSTRRINVLFDSIDTFAGLKRKAKGN